MTEPDSGSAADSASDSGHSGEIVFFASDMDGDRCMFGNAPDDEVRRWVVVAIAPDGSREIEEASDGHSAYRPDNLPQRPVWDADRDAGSWFEITLPTGAVHRAWATRWSRGDLPPTWWVPGDWQVRVCVGDPVR